MSDKTELRGIVTEALMGMIAAVVEMSPPAGAPVPPFIQSAIDRAVERIASALAQQPAPVPVPSDFALRSRVADLLHLLQFAKIETPSHGDAAQAEVAMNDLDRMLAAPAAPVAQDQVALPDGITISKDFFGTVHIKLGDFDFIQIKYDHRYTYNSHQEWVASRIVEAITAPPAAKHPGTVVVPRELLERCKALAGYEDSESTLWKELRALLAGGEA